MGKRGPPKKYVDWTEVDKLISYQCTQEEVAAFFDIDLDTLAARVLEERGLKLSELWDKKKAVGRVKHRKTMTLLFEKGGPGASSLGIYLDKKYNPHENPNLLEAQARAAAEVKQSALVQVVKPKFKTFEDFCVDAKYPRPYPLQVSMKTFALTVDDPRLILGARGYGKTDYVTVLGVAYEVYADWYRFKYEGQLALQETNLIISKSKKRNTAMIGEIADALTNNGVPLSTENSTSLRVEGLIGKDDSVEVLTIKSSFRGRHPKRIIMDDPVTEEDTSEAQRELVVKKYDEAYKLCKNIVIIGQPAHAFDLYAKLRNLIKKLEVPWGAIPELDADLVAMKLAGISEKSIEMSYHLRIPKDGSSVFSNLKYIDQIPTGDKFAFIDPSDGGDYTAMSIFRGYFDGISVLGKALQKAWFHCLDEIAEECVKHSVKKIFFETNMTGEGALIQLRAVFDPLGIVVEGVWSTTNKESVILAAGSYAHMIHLSKESDKAYTNQVVEYGPKAKHDDAPDSLGRGLEVVGLVKGKIKR